MSLTERLLTMLNSRTTADVHALYAEDYSGVDVTDRSRVHGPAATMTQSTSMVPAGVFTLRT